MDLVGRMSDLSGFWLSGVLSVNRGVMNLECRGLSKGSDGWVNGVLDWFGFFVNVGVSDCDG